MQPKLDFECVHCGKIVKAESMSVINLDANDPLAGNVTLRGTECECGGRRFNFPPGRSTPTLKSPNAIRVMMILDRITERINKVYGGDE